MDDAEAGSMMETVDEGEATGVVVRFESPSGIVVGEHDPSSLSSRVSLTAAV